MNFTFLHGTSLHKTGNCAAHDNCSMTFVQPAHQQNQQLGVAVAEAKVSVQIQHETH